MFLRKVVGRSFKLVNNRTGQKVCRNWAYNGTTENRPIFKYGWIILGSLAGAGACLTLYSFSNNVAQDDPKKRIVVLGSGWGAVNFLKQLKPGMFEVSVVSPSNYFLFTPFLPSVTVGTVEGRSTVEPIRKILGKRHKDQAKYYEAECMSVDVGQKKVFCADTSGIIGKTSEFSLDYDYLVVAVGGETATYNIEGVKEHTHFLKDISDAQIIRRNIMDLLETAAYPGQDEEEIKRLLHFVVVGGGPTGVEFAAELRDFVGKEISKLYPCLKDMIKLTLIGGYRGVLSTYDDEIGHYVENKFHQDSINVIKGVRVKKIEEGAICLQDGKTKEIQQLPYGMCVWSAGIAPRQLTKDMIKAIPDQKNRNALLTNEYLQVKNAPGVFAIGDCATIEMKRLVHDVTELFNKADFDKDGSLSLDEFKVIMEAAKKLYPQVTLHLSTEYNESLKQAFETADANGDGRLCAGEFKKFLGDIDGELKSLPATAQVATQQGKYLAKLISNKQQFITDEGDQKDLKNTGVVEPFHYHHFGSFAYVGDNRAVLQLPIIGTFKGLGAMLLWRAAYTNECVGWRMKTLVVLDWMKAAVFGRDTSRI